MTHHPFVSGLCMSVEEGEEEGTVFFLPFFLLFLGVGGRWGSGDAFRVRRFVEAVALKVVALSTNGVGLALQCDKGRVEMIYTLIQ